LFQRLAAKLDWESNAFASAYYAGLKDSVKDKMGIERPDEYKKLVARSIEIDNWLYERAMERKGFQGKTSGAFYQKKNRYQSYGDPMDLDNMERGRPSRPKGKFQRQGLSPKERERRKKDNLCYNCGKSGHRARECGTRPQGLHMMDDIAGIGETKADTPMKKELERLKNKKELQQASRVEKAQKESEKTQGEGALPPPQDKRGEEVTETAGTCHLGSSDDEEADKYEIISKNDAEAWAYCLNDLCPTHRPFKEQSGWFPHGRKGKAKTDKFRKARREMLAVMEQEEIPHWEKYRMVMQGNYVAVISTPYWSEVPCNGYCTEPGPELCGGTHRKFSPHNDSQEKEELVPLTRCDAMKCDKRRTHTHDVVGEDTYDFPFALSDDTDTDSEYEEALLDRTNLREVGSVLKRGGILAFIRTNY
jgi:hypothetical protein